MPAAEVSVGDDPAAAASGAPDLGRLRLLAGSRTAALVDPEGAVLWWCAPDPDSPPLLWRLLSPDGGVARWLDVVHSARPDTAVDARLTTELTTGEGTFLVEDVIADPSSLVRTLTTSGGPVTARLEIRIPGFGEPSTGWDDSGRASVDGTVVRVEGADRLLAWGGALVAEVALDATRARTIVMTVGAPGRGSLDDAVATREEQWRQVGRRARLPRDHPVRAADALRVLTACTYAPTGAVLAAPTTSLPEAPGGERNWDYRFCWLRDASIAASVASQLGQPRVATQYLAFVLECTGLGTGSLDPLVTVEGGPVPEEQTLECRLWSGVGPVRLGNGAAAQIQLDAAGFLAEALWTHRCCGGAISADLHALLGGLADRSLGRPGPTSGIWELREPTLLVTAELGRWLLLDRAIKLRRLRRPWRRAPAQWREARTDAAHRVVRSAVPHGWLPLGFEHPLSEEPDAAGLLTVITGLLRPDDPAAHRLVDTTIAALGSGPFLRRYRDSVDDGFASSEGAFVPASWWAVSALATLGRIDEAAARADALCAALPTLLPEEWDVAASECRGNLPLVWSHMEAARALYLLHCARIEQRVGRIGLAAWRAWRLSYVKLTPS